METERAGSLSLLSRGKYGACEYAPHHRSVRQDGTVAYQLTDTDPAVVERLTFTPNDLAYAYADCPSGDVLPGDTVGINR